MYCMYLLIQRTEAENVPVETAPVPGSAALIYGPEERRENGESGTGWEKQKLSPKTLAFYLLDNQTKVKF